MKHDHCPKCGAPVPASPAPLPPHHCDACLAEAARIINKERKTMPKKENPFDDADAGDHMTGARKYLTEEEYQEFRRLSAKIMAGIGKSGAGGLIGGRAKTEAKQAASRANGRRGGRPRKPDNELKRPRRTPKVKETKDGE